MSTRGASVAGSGLLTQSFLCTFLGSEFCKPPRPVLQPFRATTARQFPSAGVTSSLMRSAFVLISLMFLSVATYAQTPAKFCDLLRNPEKYRDQRVEVRATFRYGFEWQQLYCLDCLDKGRAWLWLPDEMDDESTRTFKKMPKGAGMVNLTVVGVLHFGGSYGHRNGYRYELIAQEIRDVAVIRKGTKGPATESKLEQLWACGGTNPK